MRPLSLILVASLPVACGGASTPPPTVEPPPPAALASLYVPNRPVEYGGGDAGAEYGGGDAGSVPISNADVVIEASRESFRRCYQTGLNVDPTMEGKVLISAKVSPTGEVLSSDVTSLKGLSTDVAACIAGVVKSARFSAPGGGGATLQIPVTFKLPAIKSP